VGNFAPPLGGLWMEPQQLLELEPTLSPFVTGGYWFKDDKSVDARLVLDGLRKSCADLGVEVVDGSVTALSGEEKTCKLENGKVYKAKDVVVAAGAWIRELLPVPIQPHKGQSFAVRAEPGFLDRVLFAQDTYIVPKSDGRIVIGATVEPGLYDGEVTVGGMMHCFNAATRLLPGIKDLPIEETWAGLRPTTPDKAPIFGETEWDGVWIAGGYWRNGVLLSPLMGKVLAERLSGVDEGEKSERWFQDFKWDR